MGALSEGASRFTVAVDVDEGGARAAVLAGWRVSTVIVEAGRAVGRGEERRFWDSSPCFGPNVPPCAAFALF